MKRKKKRILDAAFATNRARVLDAASTIVKNTERLKEVDLQAAALRAECIRYIVAQLCAFLLLACSSRSENTRTETQGQDAQECTMVGEPPDAICQPYFPSYYPTRWEGCDESPMQDCVRLENFWCCPL